MRNLQTIYQNCIDMLDSIGINYGNIVEIKVNKRAKKRWGYCQRVWNGTTRDGKRKYNFYINISHILLDERIGIESLENTIIHEILHTCPGCFDHGNGWKQMAAKVKNKLGYDIQRVDSVQNKIGDSAIYKEYVKPKYIVRCKKCGREVGKQRMCGIVKYPQNWRCGVCHGEFERIV